MDYTVNVESATCLLSLYEIIEILGILTSNAAENYEDVAGDKIIRFTIQETLRNLYIEVSNKSKKFSVSEIEKMFKYGYSTKGTERGMGLPRIKQLAEKTNSDIIVDNKMFDEENWLSFAIVIPKEEGESRYNYSPSLLGVLVFGWHWEFRFTPENNANVIETKFPTPINNCIPHFSLTSFPEVSPKVVLINLKCL